MEPQASPTPEQGSVPPLPETNLPSEQAETVQPAPEKLAPKGETVSQSAPIAPVTSLPKPVDSDDTDLPSTPIAKDAKQDTTGPAVADDVDVIEKEWVDKAKSIVNEHRHDPYNQEKETSKLQADYLKKRYGKDVKLSP